MVRVTTTWPFHPADSESAIRLQPLQCSRAGGMPLSHIEHPPAGGFRTPEERRSSGRRAFVVAIAMPPMIGAELTEGRRLLCRSSPGAG
jgi:hypothetical protein